METRGYESAESDERDTQGEIWGETMELLCRLQAHHSSPHFQVFTNPGALPKPLLGFLWGLCYLGRPDHFANWPLLQVTFPYQPNLCSWGFPGNQSNKSYLYHLQFRIFQEELWHKYCGWRSNKYEKYVLVIYITKHISYKSQHCKDKKQIH